MKRAKIFPNLRTSLAGPSRNCRCSTPPRCWRRLYYMRAGVHNLMNSSLRSHCLRARSGFTVVVGGLSVWPHSVIVCGCWCPTHVATFHQRWVGVTEATPT